MKLEKILILLILIGGGIWVYTYMKDFQNVDIHYTPLTGKMIPSCQTDNGYLQCGCSDSRGQVSMPVCSSYEFFEVYSLPLTLSSTHTTHILNNVKSIFTTDSSCQQIISRMTLVSNGYYTDNSYTYKCVGDDTKIIITNFGQVITSDYYTAIVNLYPNYFTSGGQ